MLADRVDSWFEEWKQQGIAEGRAEGREEGQQQGRTQALRQTLEKLIQLKFGNLPQGYAQRIQQADNSELELWTERILFADSIEALFA